MTQAMTQETPGKVLSLLGVAVASLAFLFMVNVSDASFSGTVSPVADPFAPAKVMAMVDTAANSYARLLNPIIVPGEQDYALAADNIEWLTSNAQDGLVAMLGINDSSAYQSAAPQVAGAVTTQPYQEKSKGFSIDSFLSSLGI